MQHSYDCLVKIGDNTSMTGDKIQQEPSRDYETNGIKLFTQWVSIHLNCDLFLHLVLAAFSLMVLVYSVQLWIQ